MRRPCSKGLEVRVLQPVARLEETIEPALWRSLVVGSRISRVLIPFTSVPSLYWLAFVEPLPAS
jgi:hypothetical protein